MRSESSIQCAGKVLTFDQTRIMGVLNVTPDSFYEKSRYRELDALLFAAEKMVGEGADVLDVGGESTRPGADGTPAESEELDRVLPVIAALSQRFDVVISVDTSSAAVMTESSRHGAGLINDVRALQRPGALVAAAKTGLPVVLMHSLVEQPEDDFVPCYEDVTQTVTDYLLQRVEACETAGIDRSHIVLDPGFGGGMFGKNPGYDLSLLKHLRGLIGKGFPVLAGLSRKSVIGAVIGKPAEERLSASLALATIAAWQGADIIRTHDVGETVDALRMVDSVLKAD